jgi:hypothetical protein
MKRKVSFKRDSLALIGNRFTQRILMKAVIIKRLL